MSTAIALKDDWSLTYAFWDCLNPYAWVIGGTIDPNEIWNIRCDGLVEYCYEYNDFLVWGKNGQHYDVSNYWYYMEHNNLYDLIWPNNADTELAPVVQRGAKGGTSTYLTLAATTDVPSCEVEQSQVGSTVYVTITATDQSGIHYIKYKKGGGGSYTSSPVQPQHPTSASYSHTVPVTSSTWLYYYAKDNGGNYPEYAEGVWVEVVEPTISGYVRTSSGSSISGVSLTFSNGGGSTTTSSSGYYSKTVSYGWSGTVTPSKSGYSFTPSYKNYSNVTSNQANQDFTGYLSLSYITITGPTEVNEDSGAQYACTAHYGDGSSSDVRSNASWSENSSYATISNSGYLTTYSVTSDRSCRIIASYEGYTHTYDMTIKPVISYPDLYDDGEEDASSKSN